MASSFIILLSAVLTSAPSQVSGFVIRDAGDGQVIATGTETSRSGGESHEQTTTYSNADGSSLWAEEKAEFRDGTLRHYFFEDRRSGENLSATVEDGGTFRIVSRAAANAQPESYDLRPPPGTYLGKSIPVLVARQWQQLKDGETLNFRLLVPERKDSYAFRARRLEAPPGRIVRILVEPDHWMIRLFAPNLVFDYEEDADGKPRLVALKAPAPLILEGERYRKVEIAFRR